ncbi:MAG: insulinase family protein [Prevotellaceae bacterium]|jgi:predicted Zn-dependent peptidase|nr:insulinase family protein [Prevotellaceae bacterium]
MKKIYTILAALLIGTAAVNAQKLDRSIQPKPAPAKEIDFKDAKTFTLSNGLKVFVVEDNRAPIVYYSLRLDVKPELEKNKAGLESLLSSVIGTATTNRSKEQLSKEIDLIGARISVNSRSGYASGLRKHEDKMLTLMADMLFNPLFSQEELDLWRDKEKSGLAMIADDPGQISERVSNVLMYGKEFPYGEVESIETLESIQIADLQKFYDTYFAPNVARLVIVGNITEKEAEANAEKYFGSWKKKNVPEAKYVLPTAPASAKVAMVNKDGAPQSTINITYPLNYKVGAPDASAVSLLQHTFGGGMSSRLFQNLRETHSYTYGVYSDISSGELIGSFSLSSGRGAASVKGVATDSSIYQIIYEMNGMINNPIGEQELKDAKAALAGSFGRSISEPSVIANYAVNIDKYNLPKDYYKNYLKRLEAVTASDIQTAAEKYLKPNNAWIIVVGDKSHAEGLKQFAGDKTVQFYDIDGNPVEAPVAKSVDVSAEQIINGYATALGGKAAIDKIDSYKMLGEMSMMGQKVEVTQAFKKPNHTSMVMSMGGMVVQKIVFDGSKLKMSGMQGEQEITEGDQLEEMKASAGICPELSYAKNGYKLTVKGVEQVNGKDAYALEVVKGSNTTIDYYDVESGLKVKSVATVDSPQGAMQQATEYGDYKPVDGVMFPHTVKQSVAGMAMNTAITSIEVNKLIDDSLF